MSLTPEQRNDIADAVEVGMDFGDTWVRFLRNGNESMLLTVIERLLAQAWIEGHNHPRRTYAHEDNPYGGAE